MPSLTDLFVNEIERRILTGEWKVGDKVPPFRTLAESFNVSRSVVNAGMVELANRGYLTTIPRRCTVIADWKQRGTMAVLDGLIKHDLYDKDFFDSMLESRRVIEVAAAWLAATRRTKGDLEELKAIILEEERVRTVEKKAEADIKFHHAIAKASHNMVFPLMLKSFESVVKKLVYAFYEAKVDLKKIYSWHKGLYNAIKDQDYLDARDIMDTLLLDGEDVVRRLFFKED